MSSILLVFLGGGLGSVLRWSSGLAMMRLAGVSFPWGTMFVNVVGCFIMGLMFRLLPLPTEGPASARLLVMTGMLGGFTTYSAFALDALVLWTRDDIGEAVAYVGGTLALCLIGVSLGAWLGKAMA